MVLGALGTSPTSYRLLGTKKEKVRSQKSCGQGTCLCGFHFMFKLYVDEHCSAYAIKMASCSAIGCSHKFIDFHTKVSDEHNDDIKLHRFPVDEEIKRKWVAALRRKNFVPTRTSKLCSQHFADDCFKIDTFGGRVLKEDAVPTIYLFFQKVEQADPVPAYQNQFEVFVNGGPNSEENNADGEFIVPIIPPLPTGANLTASIEYLDYLKSILADAHKELETSQGRFGTEMRKVEERFDVVLTELTQINVEQFCELN